jgi:TRAP-type C4-dicarboxylate transport system permease small subunit
MYALWIGRADDFVHRVENCLLTLALSVILILMLGTIVARYMLNAPITWSEEVLMIVFIWATFIGASASFHQRTHIRVDLLIVYSPRPIRLAIAIVGIVVTFAVLGALAHAMLDYIAAVRSNQTPMLGIPIPYVLWVIPIAMAISALHLVRHAVESGLETTLASNTEFVDQKE